MVYRGAGPPRVRGRGRPFRARGRGWRGPYRGRGGPNRGGHQDEGLRITLRNVGPDPQRDRREGPEYDRRSDTRDHGPGSREDYDYGDESYGQREEGYGEDRPKRESQPGQSPPRKRPHVESDFPPDESLRITVGNDLYEKVEQPPHEAHFQGGDRNEGQSERRDSWQSERRDDRGWEGDRERYDSSRGQNAGPYDARDSGYRGGGRGQPSFPPRGFDSSRGQRGLQWHRGRGDRLGESHRGRGRSDYNYTDRPTQNDRDDQRWPERRRSFSREGRRSWSPGPHRRSRERNSRSHSRGRSGDRRSYSRCRSYSRGRRSYSRSRSGSRGRRSNSRGRSRSRGRSLSRGRRSFSRSRSRGRSYNRIRRSAEKRGSQGRSLSRGRRNLRRSGSRGRSYSRSSSRSPRGEQAYNRAGSNGGPSPADNTMANTTGTEMDRSNEQGGRSKSLGPSVRTRSREPGHHSRSRSRDPDSSSSSSSSSSRSSPSDQASQHQEVSEKEYETEMYQRLKSELTANYADPREREERIAKHIREMAKLSPVLFRQFMSKNAGNLSAMTLGPPENEPAQEPDTDQTTGESGDSKPLRSILKRKGDSLSPPRDRNPSPPPEKPMTQIEKVIQSLRKGGKPEPEKVPEKEPSPPPTGALRQLSSYTDDIEDEEEFLYGDALKPKVDKPSTTTSLPFWSANRFQGKKERSLSPPLDANKPSLDIFEDVTANKTAETKIPSALDSFEDKEKSYEQWRATFLQKPKEKEADPLPSSTEETKETSENLSSTVENILKSIGFNFDLSRRMQELARQKKEQEQQSLMINQSASFLSAGGFPGDIKDSVFQRDEPEDMKTPDVASLLDQVRLATKLAQEKARKAKELEERHLHPQQKETSHGRDGKYREEPSKRRESPIRRGSGDRERDKGLYLPPDVSHSPYEPTEPRDLPYPDQYAPQYDEYGYERYNYFPAHSDFPPDFEGHQPKPVRTSNLISLAGDIDLASFDISNKEVGIKSESSPPLKIKGRSGDRRGQEDDMYKRAMEERGRERQVDGSYRRTSGSMEDISPRRGSASGRSEEKGSMEETSYKHSGERILIVKKTEDKSGESPGSDSGFTRRIVLPPKEKSKSLHVRSSETDTRREVIRRSPSPSEPQRNSRRVESHAGSSKVVRRTSSPKASPRHKESPFSARTYKRPASPVTSPKQSKQPRGESPHDYKSKPEPSKSRWEPLKSVPELSKTKQGISADIRKTERKHEPVKIDTDHAKKLAQEKLKLLKQQEERKEKIRVLEERKEKIRILERELFALKQQHNELLRKRRRQKDGHKDPLLGENVKLQDEITAQLKALRDGRDTESGYSVQDKSSGAKTKSGDGGLSSKPEEKPAVETAVKKEAPKVRFEYFDPGSHWCQSCNVMCGHMFDFFKHIESKKHQQKLDPFDKPWLMEALQKSEGKMKDGPVQAHPIKGLEFMMATAAFYCPLCKEFCGDLSIAESHMKSDEHTEKYREYITQHPYYEKRYILERSASLSMQRPYSPEPDPDDESSDDDSRSQSSGSKKKSSGHGSSADKKREKEEKKKGMSEEEKSRKKSDKDEKKKCEKDDQKHDKDEKKYDRDQKGRDEKDNDKDMKKSRKKEFKGIPAEGESRMYSDRGEFRRDLDRDDSRQKKDQKVSDHKPSPKHEKDSKSRNCETDSKPPPKEEKSEPEKVEPEVDKAEPALEKSMPRPVSDSIPEDQTAEKTTEKENIDTVAEGKSDVSTTEGKEKEPDADSKSKIAIKLTGKTGIKAAPAASLPPWKVLTRPIPKTSVRSRLLSGRAQATASGLGPGPAPPNEDPVPLDDFLTVGSKQNMPVPVVPDTPKDLPAPKDPKTGKVELEETERQEEMKQMGIEPMSLAPSIQPVAPPPPSQNLSLPPGFQPHPQPSASNESLETSTDSLVPASDSETSCEQQSLKPSTSSDTDSYDSVKERKRGEQSDGDSASDKDDKKPGPNDETDAKLLPVLDAIPLPADIPIPPTPPAKDPPTSTASSATASSKPQPPKEPPPLLTPLSGRKTLLSAPTVPPPGGYGSSNIAQGHNIPQGGYGLSNTSQGGYGPSSMSQGGYGTSQGGYNYPNTSQGGYGPNSQGGYGPPMMGGMGPMYPPQFPFGCGPPMYNMPGPMGPMPGPMGPGPMSGPMGPGPMGPGPMGPGPMGPGPMGPGPMSGPGPMPYQGIGGWGPGPNMPPYNAPVSMSGPSSRPPGRAAVSTSAGPRTGQSTSKPAAATSKPADTTLATKAVDASPAPSTTTAPAPPPSDVVSDSVSTLAAPQSSSAGATEQSQAPSTTTSSELPHSFELDQVNSTSVLESNSVLAPMPSTGTSTSTVFSSQPSPSETVATAAPPHSSDTALSVFDCITIADTQDTVTPKVSSQKPAVVDSTPSNTSPTKGRRTRARPQARPLVPVRQTRSRTAKKAATESASPVIDEAASCGEDSNLEEPIPESPDAQSQNSSEASEATSKMRVGGGKKTGKGKKAVVKKEIADSHEAVPVVVTHSSSSRGCVLDLTNPPVDSSVQLAVSTEVTSIIAAAESSASEAQCRTPTEEKSVKSEPAPVAQAGPASEAEDSALNLTVPPQQRRVRRGRVVEQTEPEDLSAWAGPQDLSKSGSSKQKSSTMSAPEMPMDLSVRLFRLPVTQSNVSNASEDMAQFLEMAQSPSSQISSSDAVQHTDSVDSHSVKDTLLSSTSAVNPSTSSQSEEADLAEEAALLADDQPVEGVSGSVQLGVDPDGDPVDFSLAPIDFEQLVGMEDSSAAPTAGNDDNADSTDTGI